MRRKVWRKLSFLEGPHSKFRGHVIHIDCHTASMLENASISLLGTASHLHNSAFSNRDFRISTCQCSNFQISRVKQWEIGFPGDKLIGEAKIPGRANTRNQISGKKQVVNYVQLTSIITYFLNFQCRHAMVILNPSPSYRELCFKGRNAVSFRYKDKNPGLPQQTVNAEFLLHTNHS